MNRWIPVLLWFVACGAPPAAEAPTPQAEDPEPIVVAPKVEEDASAPITETPDASIPVEAATPTASADAAKEAAAAEPEKPLVLKGARRCTEEETQEEVCFESHMAGLCREGLCIHPKICPKYCAAFAEREHEGCMVPPDADCKKIPECASTFRELRTSCKKMITETRAFCMEHSCGQLKFLPHHKAP